MKPLNRIVNVCLAVFLFCALSAGPGQCGDPADTEARKRTLRGVVSDVGGKPVEGAMVFIYTTRAVRRPADFMSAPTGSDGVYRAALPAGRYWAVARLKRADFSGPLMPGDKHSWDPVEVDLASQTEAVVDFTVADLREATAMREKPREGAFRISGRIVDERGAPVRDAYAFADRNKEISAVPDYVSAGVGEDGVYVLFVPKGKYFLGAAAEFPPGPKYEISAEIAADSDKSLDIVLKSQEDKERKQ